MKKSAHMRRQAQKEKRDVELTEIEELNAKLKAQEPPRGTNPLAEDLNTGTERTPENYWPCSKLFETLPISEKTKRGLKNGQFTEMTEVQRATLPHALVGRDVLGASKTGSGKTLAFLIPILEKLYRLKWSKMDGLGALIISPTHELAMQTFMVLRTIGAPHTLTAGLLIGGTNWKAEQHRIGGMNILVATPGRLLQHMDESPTFRADNLQVLVLDEADQILSAGFQKEINAIIGHLPSERQTLLFSATQTSSVADLARLSLDKPEFLSIHAEADNATPDRLVQNYIIMDEGEKLNILWSFIKAHLRKKIIVFFQSQRQVKFVFEAFRHMRPGLPVMHLHGNMGQATRKDVHDKFDKAKFAVMLCTDVASRGLDFEGIHWVIQVDCPDRVESYIHRVGRTARNGSSGRSTLFLLPSEVEFREALVKSKIPISKTNINSARALEIDQAIQALLIQKPDLKLMAQKALKSYLKAVYLQADKTVFDVTKLNMEALAQSYGLLQVPRIRFMDVKKIDKNAERMKAKLKSIEAKIKKIDETAAAREDDGTGYDGDEALLALFKKQKETKQGRTKLERLLAKKNEGVLTKEHAAFRPEAGHAVFDFDSEEESGEDVLIPKKKSAEEIARENAEMADFSAPKREKKERHKISIYKESENQITFEDSDEEKVEDEGDSSVPYARRIAKLIEAEDAKDREVQFEKLRERRRKKVAKLKEARREAAAKRAEEEGLGAVTIGNPIGSDDDWDGEDGASGSGSDDDNGHGGSDYSSGGSDSEEEEAAPKRNGRAQFQSRRSANAMDEDFSSGSDDEEGSSEEIRALPKHKAGSKHTKASPSDKKNLKKRARQDDAGDQSDDSESAIPRKKITTSWSKKRAKMY